MYVPTVRIYVYVNTYNMIGLQFLCPHSIFQLTLLKTGATNVEPVVMLKQLRMFNEVEFDMDFDLEIL